MVIEFRWKAGIQVLQSHPFHPPARVWSVPSILRFDGGNIRGKAERGIPERRMFTSSPVQTIVYNLTLLRRITRSSSVRLSQQRSNR